MCWIGFTLAYGIIQRIQIGATGRPLRCRDLTRNFGLTSLLRGPCCNVPTNHLGSMLLTNIQELTSAGTQHSLLVQHGQKPGRNVAPIGHGPTSHQYSMLLKALNSSYLLRSILESSNINLIVSSIQIFFDSFSLVKNLTPRCLLVKPWNFRPFKRLKSPCRILESIYEKQPLRKSVSFPNVMESTNSGFTASIRSVVRALQRRPVPIFDHYCCQSRSVVS